MICRIWHGYTTRQNADAYEQLLKNEIFTEIKEKQIEGYKDIELLIRQTAEEVEFVTIMHFISIEAVKQFAGEDHEKAVVPLKAQKLLKRYDDRSVHYEVKYP